VDLLYRNILVNYSSQFTLSLLFLEPPPRGNEASSKDVHHLHTMILFKRQHDPLSLLSWLTLIIHLSWWKERSTSYIGKPAFVVVVLLVVVVVVRLPYKNRNGYWNTRNENIHGHHPLQGFNPKRRVGLR
jgi:hypothetical protein